MQKNEIKKLHGFYTNELCHNFLSFWLPRCEDKEYGGFLNCFDNAGEKLCSYDKYTWSQGRFIWTFSRLAGTTASIFSQAERKEFLRLAKQGAEFLMQHCLIGDDDWRCVFLMERDGAPKEVTPSAPLDMSVYADCFAVLGCGMYAFVANEPEYYFWAEKLYDSIVQRVKENNYNTLPYPLSHCYRAHGIPMILDNTARELYRAAERFHPEKAAQLKEDMLGYCEDELTHFVDENNALHEIITINNEFFPQILGQHMNPGHTIEDAWFMLDTAEICNHEELKDKIFAVTKKAFSCGWDKECGGMLHFSGLDGGKPEGDYIGVENEKMTQQLACWDDKLWWVHSESLYTSLRCYFASGDAEFLGWHEKVFDYTYQVFPNIDPEIREWKQIRRRDGTPEDRVVALPVKDPFHIMRNLILIIELLERQMDQ